MADSVGSVSEVVESLRSNRLATQLRSDLEAIMICCLLLAVRLAGCSKTYVRISSSTICEEIHTLTDEIDKALL